MTAIGTMFGEVIADDVASGTNPVGPVRWRVLLLTWNIQAVEGPAALTG